MTYITDLNAFLVLIGISAVAIVAAGIWELTK